MDKVEKKGETLDKLTQVNNALHKVLCGTIQNLLQNSIKREGITEQEIETAREFAELKPNTKAAKELLDFLDRDEVKEALKPGIPD